jgi:hypothetical protein
MQAVVHAADLQDRDGGVLLMGTLFGLYPFLLKLYADAGYQGAKFQDGLKAVCRTVNVEIVRRRDLQKFVVLPKRWIVERTIACGCAWSGSQGRRRGRGARRGYHPCRSPCRRA